MRGIEVLEKKYSIAILIYLARNDGASSKRSLQMEFSRDKTILNRIKELTELGFISCHHADANYNNSYIIDLTEKGKKIADRLAECESYLG
jgi:DNA-binding HxlR family transcriptional regulator